MTELTALAPEAQSGVGNRLIIYGLDEGGRAHASKFSSAHAELVERAAAAMVCRAVTKPSREAPSFVLVRAA